MHVFKVEENIFRLIFNERKTEHMALLNICCTADDHLFEIFMYEVSGLW